jgi:hypothetical protein
MMKLLSGFLAIRADSFWVPAGFDTVGEIDFGLGQSWAGHLRSWQVKLNRCHSRKTATAFWLNS